MVDAIRLMVQIGHLGLGLVNYLDWQRESVDCNAWNETIVAC